MALENFRTDPGAADPLYVQLAAKLRSLIAGGDIDVGGALPSERLLSEQTGTSRVTIRKAIEQLVEEGLLTRRHGSGTYVAAPIKPPAGRLTGFTADARGRGVNASSVWIVKTTSSPASDEAEILQLGRSDAVARLGRVRLADDEPLAIEHAVVPMRMLPPLGEIGDSLYAALDRTHSRPERGIQKLRAAKATPIEAGLLSIPQDSSVLRIERTSFLADGTPVELTRSAYRGDRYEFVHDLTVEPAL
ncbi:GntR family transcriptional regulator [Pacificimonas flava]|uniref:Transcriptional regulator of N-Acetylglucosamine utilization, GntR family n=1 Tax=Pacificimonas flava TaxID=1234595 RepID=M2S8K7_9SPHN|nr:GntR family transcriptional regulator [Pacificimonas flava]EMD81715.1 transcriptional regulator of N-Acetylglucosamine utilization, GntR family [Pacificimonas flava]MBB5281718.1 GntR family transcriptional regulator [Pacificimonas flava]